MDTKLLTFTKVSESPRDIEYECNYEGLVVYATMGRRYSTGKYEWDLRVKLERMGCCYMPDLWPVMRLEKKKAMKEWIENNWDTIRHNCGIVIEQYNKDRERRKEQLRKAMQH